MEVYGMEEVLRINHQSYVVDEVTEQRLAHGAGMGIERLGSPMTRCQARRGFMSRRVLVCVG